MMERTVAAVILRLVVVIVAAIIEFWPRNRK